MACEDFKDLARKTASDKFLRDKAFNIAKNPEYDGYRRGLTSMVYKMFDKKKPQVVVPKNEIKQNQQLAEELHKPTIKKKIKRRAYSSFKNHNWGADLAHIQLISKFN